MFAYFHSRAGRCVALLLGILLLTTVGSAQTQLRGPPLNQRPNPTVINQTDSTGKVIGQIIIPATNFPLMPPSPQPRPLNNGSLGDFPVGANSFVFGFPPIQGGNGGGFGGGFGGFSGGFGGGGFSGGFGGGGFSGGFGGGGFSGGFGGGGFSGGFGGGGFGGFGGFSRGIDPTGGFSGFGGAGFGGAFGAVGGF